MAAPGLRSIADLAELATQARHVRAHYAPVHQGEAAQIGVYLLEPGGGIPAHRHTASWDISLVIEGEIEARFLQDGAWQATRCGCRAINLVPPGVVHAISNSSATEPARFLLVQSPSRNFDFLRTEG